MSAQTGLTVFDQGSETSASFRVYSKGLVFFRTASTNVLQILIKSMLRIYKNEFKGRF